VTVPPRGFPVEEYRSRTAGAQRRMAEAGLSALLLTTEADVRYFSGFLTRFWESPTRPWFLVVPDAGDPIAVIPEIGAPLMGRTWISDIRTWPSPDLSDDGVSLLAGTLAGITGPSAEIGLPMGPETHLRMPLSDFRRLKTVVSPRRLVDDRGIVRALRMVKSQREIEKIAHACAIADRAFRRVPEIAQVGVPLSDVFRRFQILCLEAGADWVPYLAGAADPGGYADIISPATDTPLEKGDVLMLDAGLVWDGYFCDYDRNFSVGPPSPETAAAHVRLLAAVEAGAAIASPGVTAAALHAAMHDILTGRTRHRLSGRLGHGLGSQLTEWPSLMPDDRTVLEAGMVLTLEPFVEVASGNILVHEENIVVEEEGARFLSTRAPSELTVV
jgi:Xaa-Pro aminopeptidase